MTRSPSVGSYIQCMSNNRTIEKAKEIAEKSFPIVMAFVERSYQQCMESKTVEECQGSIMTLLGSSLEYIKDESRNI